MNSNRCVACPHRPGIRVFVFTAVFILTLAWQPHAAAEGALELIGTLGGRSEATALWGRYLYIAEGRSVVTIDLEAEGGPAEIWRTPVPIKDEIQKLVCNGRVLCGINGEDGYISTGAGEGGSTPEPSAIGCSGPTIDSHGLFLLDLADPKRPVSAALIPSQSPSYFLTLGDHHLYVPDQGLFDISNPYAPRSSAGPALPQTHPLSVSVVADRLAWMGDNPATISSLVMYGLEEPPGTAPLEYTFDPEWAWDIAITMGSAGDSRFFVIGIDLDSGTTYIVAMEIADDRIELRSMLQSPGLFLPIAAAGTDLLTTTPYYVGLCTEYRIYHVFQMDPKGVIRSSKFPLSPSAYSRPNTLVAPSLHSGLLSDADPQLGIRVRRIDDGYNSPPLLTRLPFAYPIRQLSLHNGRLFALTGAGMSVFQACPAGPFIPTGKWQSDSGAYEAFDFVGNHAILTRKTDTVLLDISAPDTPVKIGGIALNGPGTNGEWTRWISPTEAVSIRGGNCALFPLVGEGCSLRRFDFADPLSPIGTLIPLTGYFTIQAADVTPNLAALAQSNMLQMVQHTPLSAQFLGTAPLEGIGREILAHQSLAVVRNPNGLQLFDFSDPATPRHLPDSEGLLRWSDINAMAIDHETLYLAGSLDGESDSKLRVVDISDPATLRLLDEIRNSPPATRMVAEGGLLAIASNQRELLLYRNRLGTRLEIINEVLGRRPAREASDLNGDGVVDAADVVIDQH